MRAARRSLDVGLELLDRPTRLVGEVLGDLVEELLQARGPARVLRRSAVVAALNAVPSFDPLGVSFGAIQRGARRHRRTDLPDMTFSPSRYRSMWTPSCSMSWPCSAVGCDRSKRSCRRLNRYDFPEHYHWKRHNTFIESTELDRTAEQQHDDRRRARQERGSLRSQDTPLGVPERQLSQPPSVWS